MSIATREKEKTSDHSRPKGHRLTYREALLGLAVVGMMAVLIGTRGPESSHEGRAFSALDPIIEADVESPSQTLTGDVAARFFLLLMEDAERSLAKVNTIRATFYKLERVDGQLGDLNVMDLKVRRAPLSIYMRWQEPFYGQELIWREGVNDEQIVAHPGGWRRKIVPRINVDPHGERAMQYARRPVMQIGIWNFHRRILNRLRADLEKPGTKVWMTDDKRIAGRPCYCFRVFHPERTGSEAYRKMLVYVDKRLSIPIACELYGWPTDEAPEEPVLEESYAFHGLELDPNLTDLDFDADNPNYDYGKR